MASAGKKILITGNMGYVGSVVVNHLRTQYPSALLIGYDTGFFAGCLVDPLVFPEKLLNKQIYGDVRSFPEAVLEQVDAVVHLAALSNDPIGEEFETLTNEINCDMSLDIAQKAKNSGVKNFVFASSCSVYGTADNNAKDEDSPLDPLTVYARSKVATEAGLEGLADDNFTITCLRFATACGFSPRLRLDLVLNDFVACALSKGKIQILSDGTPLRPLMDVKDMARAIDWAIHRKADVGGSYLIVNTGSNKWNYQIRELAETVRSVLHGVQISVNDKAAPDKRSYKVDFSLYEGIAPNHQPVQDITTSIHELANGLRRMNFQNGSDFRNSYLVRLSVLRGLKESGQLTEELYWNKA